MANTILETLNQGDSNAIGIEWNQASLMGLLVGEIKMYSETNKSYVCFCHS
jgi:hypothetical protein